MWTVKSEWGRLNAVLVQDSAAQAWTERFPFAGVESSTHYVARDPHAQLEEGHRQWMQLPGLLSSQGVQVFEVVETLTRILEDATLAERREMVEMVWRGLANPPNPGGLTVDHLLWGNPPHPYYDAEGGRVVFPSHRMVSWGYPRDTSFTTQVGTVICNMRRFSRRFEPRVVKLCYLYDPVLSEKTRIIYDANEVEGVHTEPPCVEGGDTHIVDEETVAIGVGQRSTSTGALEAARRVFAAEWGEEVRYCCIVALADPPAVDYMHLDTVINYPEEGRALVVPYVFDTELVEGYPPKRLLLKALEAVRRQSEEMGRPLAPLVHPSHFQRLGATDVYVNQGGEPRLLLREKSLLDFLVREGKVEPDGFIYVGGDPEDPWSVPHMLGALMEQSRGASNIVTVKPGTVIAYDRNTRTNRELRSHGIKVLEWESSYLDLLGGPHCSTCPLSRDPH